MSIRTKLNENGVGYSEVIFSNPSPQIDFKRCNCPKNWAIAQYGHHQSCIRCTRCSSCGMSKSLCSLLKSCKWGIFKENPKRKAEENTSYAVILQNLKRAIQNLFQQIQQLIQRIVDSAEKKSCFKRVLDCKSQYEAIASLPNASAATVDSAEKCLYKLKCVLFDMKAMLKAQQAVSSGN